MNTDDLQLKRAENAALLSLLNLTVLPLIGFIGLLYVYGKTKPNTIDRYYAVVGIKTSLLAGIALLLVTLLVIQVGGFESPLTWVYVTSYFVIVHASFILFATWTLTRSWAGEKLKRQVLSK